MRLWLLIIRDGHVRIVIAAWLLTTCISMHAQDSKLAPEDAQKHAAQLNVPPVKDGKTKIADGADPASCVIKSDDPGIVTKTGEAASPTESDDHDRMTKASNEASSGDNLSLQPAPEEWGRDRIHLAVETNLRQESRSEKSETGAASDLKCTPHEGASNTEAHIPK
jgi:hypothetical protein